MELRPYQQKIIDDISTAAVGGDYKILVTSPVGSGKTVIFSDICRHASKQGKRILILVHRRELLYQAQEKIKRHGIECGIILADEPHDPTLPVQIATIQSLHSKGLRRSRIDMPKADIVICDEAHRIMAGQWQEVLDKYDQAYIIGFSATPIRRDGKGLGDFFEVLIHGPSVKELITQNHLVDVRIFAPSIPDLAGLKVVAGDYVENELERRMDKPELIGDVVQNFARICPDKKAIVFASGVKHSIHLSECFNKIGIKAAHIDGTTNKKERDEIIKGFRGDSVQILCNCAVVEEGADFPEAEVLVFARPTKSLRLYLQIVGRVMRPSPNKETGLLLDHAGVVYEHGLPSDDWEWKLEYGTCKNIKEAMRPQIEIREKKRITCGGCKYVYSGMLFCPLCHWKPTVRGKAVETYEAYLQELSRPEVEAITLDEKSWYLQLKCYGERKGYKSGWAKHKYREKTGKWPGTSWDQQSPIEPSKEVLAYIQHLMIKWAKSQQKRDTVPWKTGAAPIGSISKTTQSHGLDRKNEMAGNAYQPD